jgi:release factor glutamine methyltransferase
MNLNLQQALKTAERHLNRNESLCILEHVTGLPRRDIIINDRLLSDAEARRFDEILTRRRTCEPLQYILGSWEFMGLPFTVKPGVLIPRWDTEVLAEKAVAHLRPLPHARVLDMCTGSGCIAVYLAHALPHAHITAADIDLQAVALANENARRHGVAERVECVLSDLFNGIAGTYDAIVINPPYIASGDIENLPDEVRLHEPHLALNGGPDGLGFYRRIAVKCPPYIRTGGRLFLEIGAGQRPAVENLLRHNFTDIQIYKDLSGIERVISCSTV